jgi:transposase InsO family protein
VLFDRICRENGIRHILTAPRSPITTGKVERFQDRSFSGSTTSQTCSRTRRRWTFERRSDRRGGNSSGVLAARHVFTYCDGMVDAKYLSAVGESPLRVGQRPARDRRTIAKDER